MALKAADPGFEPARPVLPATVWPNEVEKLPQLSDRETARVGDLFNVGYEILLQVLHRFFNNIDETDAQRMTLADVAVGLMFEVIGPLGRYLTELPAGPEHPGRTAGPTFELFYTSDYLLPHRRAAWILLEERLRGAAAFGRRLEGYRGQGPLGAVVAAYDRFADRLAAASA
jgi:hypothetical protein